MLRVRKRSWMMTIGAVAVLAGGVVGPVQAGSAVTWGDFSASAGDRLTATSMEAGNQYVLKSSSLSVGDIEALQAEQKRSTSALQSLTSKVEGQDRELDELKRKGGSAASAGDSQLSSLKSTIQDQKSTIDRQKSDIDALKRSLDDLKRSVESLSSKVK